MKNRVFLLGILVITLCICSCLRFGNIPNMCDSFDLAWMHTDAAIYLENEESIASLNKEREMAEKLYNRFLSGEIYIDGIGHIDDMTIPTGEPDRHRKIGYAYQDSNGDGIPELHINSGRYYNVISCKDKELFLWKELHPYPYCFGLKNGAFMTYDARQSLVYYSYFILDYSGDTIFEIKFSKDEKRRYQISDMEDEYTFDGVIVSEEAWMGLTKRYLYIDETGIERIRDEIEWLKLDWE